MDVSIITVNYNTRDKLRECLKSIERNASGLGVETIVVDNASSDGSVEMVKKEFPSARLISNAENRYFTGANNQGFTVSSGRNILILNSDTQVLEDSLKVMSEFLDRNEKAGAVTCKMHYPDGRFYKNAAKDFSLGLALLNCTLLGSLLKPIKEKMNREFGYADENWSNNKEVEMIGDCNMMIKRFVLDRIGHYDERMKLYYTENDFCLRIRALGYKIFYLAGGSVLHHLRGTVSQSGVQKISRIYHDDTLVYFKKYHGFLSAALLGALIWLTNLLLSIMHFKNENVFTRFLTSKKSA